MSEKYGKDAGDIQTRQAEEAMYEQVAAEMAARDIKKGLWAKALALSDGSAERAKALYIKLRVQALRDEAALKTAQERPRAPDAGRQAVKHEAAAAPGGWQNYGAPERPASAVEKPRVAAIEKKVAAAPTPTPVKSDNPKTDTSLGVIAGRHLLGLALFALASPVVWRGEGFAGWLSTLVFALVAAAVITGVLSLFFTKRAKARGARGMAGSFFITAWVLVGLGILGQWQSVSHSGASQRQQSQQSTAPAPARSAAQRPAPAPAQTATAQSEYRLERIEPEGNTALMLAARDGDAASVKRLLAAGVDVNAFNEDGETALMFASESGHAEIAALLINAGAYINATTKKGKATALMVAAQYGHAEVVRRLIQAGADVNVVNKNGFTALLAAYFYGNPEIVKSNIEAGLPMGYGHTEVVHLLRAAGAREVTCEGGGRCTVH